MDQHRNLRIFALCSVGNEGKRKIESKNGLYGDSAICNGGKGSEGLQGCGNQRLDQKDRNKGKVSTKKILVNVEAMAIDPDEFCAVLEVELEHCMRVSNTNVINKHPVLTGLIGLAHFKESLD